jgi:hypothetical protein
MVQGSNATNYHFRTYKLDENNDKIDETYYISCKIICELYKCSRFTVYYKINNPTVKSRTFPDIFIEKIREPFKISINNPRIAHILTPVNTTIITDN